MVDTYSALPEGRSVTPQMTLASESADSPIAPADTLSAPSETSVAATDTASAPAETPTPTETPIAPTDSPSAQIETPGPPAETAGAETATIGANTPAPERVESMPAAPTPTPRAPTELAAAEGTGATEPVQPTATAAGVRPTPCPLDHDGSLPKEVVLPGIRESVLTPKKKEWEKAFGGEEAARPHIQARLADWPQQLLVSKDSLPKTDRDFLLRLARDTWRGLAALTDRESGLPIDNVRFSKGSVAVADARIGDYASGTDIGLYLMATVAAVELQLLTPPEAIAKIRKVLDTLEHLPTLRGFLFNFYDTTSLERTSDFVSFIDASWLTAGLMVVRTTFAELYEQCSKLIAQTDYGFFYNQNKKLFSHGYYINPESYSPYDYGVLYTEARLGSLIAIGKGDAPEELWFKMIRTFAEDCAGQTQPPKGTRSKTIDGYTFSAGYYEWHGLHYVPSWGGSMFEALMPTLVLDEAQYAPQSLGVNDHVHAEVQRRYARDELGYEVWGISPSSTPHNDSYAEYGVQVLGSYGYFGGAVTPHAAALALAVTPDAATANLRKLAELYDVYGEYGFYDALDPRSGEVAYKYLVLDQSMLLVATANYLNDHCIQKRFAADPIAQKALPIIGVENFFE